MKRTWGTVAVACALSLSACASKSYEQDGASEDSAAATDDHPGYVAGKHGPDRDPEVGTPEATADYPADDEDGYEGLIPRLKDLPGDDKEGDDLPEDAEDGDDTSADPHSKRAGGKGKRAPRDAPGRVTFTAPAEDARPVDPARRPTWKEPAGLALALVRDGELAHSADVLLEYGELLAKESAVVGVFALDALKRSEAGLAELAAQAKSEGRPLLLVDVRPGPPGYRRVGYLVHTDDGTLLARYAVPDGGSDRPVSTGGAADLCARLGAVYARAKD